MQVLLRLSCDVVRLSCGLSCNAVQVVVRRKVRDFYIKIEKKFIYIIIWIIFAQY